MPRFSLRKIVSISIYGVRVYGCNKIILNVRLNWIPAKAFYFFLKLVFICAYKY